MLIALILPGCSEKRSAEDMMNEFILSYGAEGIIYAPSIPESCDGYIYDGLFERIYIADGIPVSDYAVFLNSHTDHVSECGVFICDSAEAREAAEQMCAERIHLICHGDSRAFIETHGNIVFYSAMSDRDRAETIWRRILKRG